MTGPEVSSGGGGGVALKLMSFQLLLWVKLMAFSPGALSLAIPLPADLVSSLYLATCP